MSSHASPARRQDQVDAHVHPCPDVLDDLGRLVGHDALRNDSVGIVRLRSEDVVQEREGAVGRGHGSSGVGHAEQSHGNCVRGEVSQFDASGEESEERGLTGHRGGNGLGEQVA